MSFLEDHSYGLFNPNITLEEVNKPVKEEFESQQSQSHDSDQDSPCTNQICYENEQKDNLPESSVTHNHEKEETLNLENVKNRRISRKRSRPVSNKNDDLRALQKASIIQTCLSLLDSSSSEDDELMLLWTFYKSKKARRRNRLF